MCSITSLIQLRRRSSRQISRRREASKAHLQLQDLHSTNKVSNLLPLSNPLTLCNHNIPEHPCC